MYKKLTPVVFGLLALSLAAYWGCQSLDTQNLNAPDTERALATPSDVESLVGGSFFQWFLVHNQWGIEHLGVTADALTCSWGNYSMKDMSSEPRTAFNNSTSYTYINAITLPWDRCYSAISAAYDGLRQIEVEGLQMPTEARTHRARAFAKLVQGLAHGYLASFFDQAFVLEEDVDINEPGLTLPLLPYQDVMAAAVAQLEEAVDLLENGPAFETREGWINGVILNNQQLAQVAHSYLARYMAQVARTPEERAAVDWSKVRSHAEQGVTAPLAPHGDGGFSWFHSQQWFHNDRGLSWARLDYKMIGGSDKSNGYQNWLDTPVAQRQEFTMDTDDQRLNGIKVFSPVVGDSVDGGIYAGEWGPSPFRAIRGIYHFSRYGYYRYEEFAQGGNVAPMPLFLPVENDFLIAEAMLWSGDAAGAAQIIDNTRVANGGYPSAAGAPIGNVTDPRSPLEGSSLWAMLKYEKHLECLMTGAGLEFFDNRGWGDLVTGTPLHMPVPARELEVLQLDIYSHGGDQGDVAPKVNLKPGPPE